MNLKTNLFNKFSLNSRALEQEQQTYMNLVENIAQDIQPIGKMQSEQTNNDESDNGSDASGGNSSESDAEAASDDSDAEEIA